VHGLWGLFMWRNGGLSCSERDKEQEKPYHSEWSTFASGERLHRSFAQDDENLS
jgi:hypothetical protein